MTDRRFMLDTDTVSFVLRGQGQAGAQLTAHAPSEICLSSISLSALRFGADKRRSKRLHNLIDTFTATIKVMPFDAPRPPYLDASALPSSLRAVPSEHWIP